MNDKYPHTFARDLAKELAKKRTWKNKAYLAHPRIRVGGYPGFIDCKVKKEKLVSLLIENGRDDPAVLTVKEPLKNHFGQTQRFGIGEAFGEIDKSEAFNRFRLEGVGIAPGRRLIMLPVQYAIECACHLVCRRRSDPLRQTRNPSPYTVSNPYRFPLANLNMLTRERSTRDLYPSLASLHLVYRVGCSETLSVWMEEWV